MCLKTWLNFGPFTWFVSEGGPILHWNTLQRFLYFSSIPTGWLSQVKAPLCVWLARATYKPHPSMRKSPKWSLLWLWQTESPNGTHELTERFVFPLWKSYVFSTYVVTLEMGALRQLFYFTENSLLVDGEDRGADPQRTCVLHSLLTLSRVMLVPVNAQ